MLLLHLCLISLSEFLDVGVSDVRVALLCLNINLQKGSRLPVRLSAVMMACSVQYTPSPDFTGANNSLNVGYESAKMERRRPAFVHYKSFVFFCCSCRLRTWKVRFDSIDLKDGL